MTSVTWIERIWHYHCHCHCHCHCRSQWRKEVLGIAQFLNTQWSSFLQVMRWRQESIPFKRSQDSLPDNLWCPRNNSICSLVVSESRQLQHWELCDFSMDMDSCYNDWPFRQVWLQLGGGCDCPIGVIISVGASGLWSMVGHSGEAINHDGDNIAPKNIPAISLSLNWWRKMRKI